MTHVSVNLSYSALQAQPREQDSVSLHPYLLLPGGNFKHLQTHFFFIFHKAWKEKTLLSNLSPQKDKPHWLFLILVGSGHKYETKQEKE